MGCSASKEPNLHYDRYKTPSDLFRELGLKYNKDSHYEYIGHNLREHHDHFNAYCKLNSGVWTLEDKTVVHPRLGGTGFYSLNAKNDYLKVSFGQCTVEGELFFDYKETWGDSKSYVIDRIAEKEYFQKIKDRRQPW